MSSVPGEGGLQEKGREDRIVREALKYPGFVYLNLKPGMPELGCPAKQKMGVVQVTPVAAVVFYSQNLCVTVIVPAAMPDEPLKGIFQVPFLPEQVLPPCHLKQSQEMIYV